MAHKAGRAARAAVRIALAAVIAVAGLVWLGPLAPPLTRMNCRVASYDIAAGRVRHERFVLGLAVSEQMTETALTSRYREAVGQPPPPQWVFMHSRSPFRIADGVGGRAFAAGGVLTAAFAMADFSPPAKRQAIETFVGLLDAGRASGDYAPAQNYANAVLAAACGRERKRIDADLLPAPPGPSASDPE